MNILERISSFESEVHKVLVESGIRNIKDLSKKYKVAEIYFHKDLDGVTTAVGMKEYLRGYGIKTIDAHTIQYGGEEYAIPTPRAKTLAVLVDFAHGKPVMHIHTDHHEGQVGYDPKNTSISFVKSPSNAAFLSQVLSPRDLFPPEDAKLISMVDSAQFYAYGVSPDEVMRAAFKVSDKIDVSKNKQAMGLVVNKLLLSYKNKSNFLSDLVMKSRPSLVSMYNVIRKLAKDNGYSPPEEIEAAHAGYEETEKERFKEGKDIKMVGNTIVQYGGGSMRGTGAYDRYTPFKLHPEAHFYCIAWPVGLIQLSKNPFKGESPYHLGKICDKVMNKYKGYLQNIDVPLDRIKWIFERDIEKKGSSKSMGFTWNDLIALYDKNIKGIGREKWKGKFMKDTIKDITNKKYSQLSDKQKNVLSKITVSAWDIIKAGSGGHKDISNISGLNFIPGKGVYIKLMKKIQDDIADEMKDKSLKS
jgi:hypothetical protein